jgi:hypothetical protein
LGRRPGGSLPMRGCRSSTSRPPDTNGWPARKRASELPVTAKTITSRRSGGSSEELIILSAASDTDRHRQLLARLEASDPCAGSGRQEAALLPPLGAAFLYGSEIKGVGTLRDRSLGAGCRTRRRQRAAAPRVALLRAFDRVKHAGDKGLRRTRNAPRNGRREDIALLDRKEGSVKGPLAPSSMAYPVSLRSSQA